MSTPQTISLTGGAWRAFPLPRGDWRARRVWEREPPEAAEAIPAAVPGCLQRDLLAAGSRTPHFAAERDWVYTREFTPPPELAGMHVRLRLEGVDGPAYPFLNGAPLGSHLAGPYAAAEFDVTAELRPGEPNRLLVVVESPFTLTAPPQVPPEWNLRPRWDGFTPVGILDDVTLHASGPVWFRDAALYTNLSRDRDEAALSIVSEFGVAEGMPVVVGAQVQELGLPVVDAQDPVTVFDSSTSLVQSLTLKRVNLWWPNGLGEPRLYELLLVLAARDGRRVLDFRRFRFGVRQVEALPCEDAPPDALPYLLSVNGRRVRLQGWDWSPADPLAGPEATEQLVERARAAGANLLRLPAGSPPERRAFYDACDEAGILVWEEFPLGPTAPERDLPADEAFLDYLAEQAEAIFPRRRNHPCLALRSGGNGLTGPDGRPLDSGHPALARLEELAATHDPQRLWLPVSPSGPLDSGAGTD